MNWYKISQGVYGEWWITDTGDVLFADGDTGDKNHEYYVIEQIIGNYFEMDSIDSPDIYTIQKMSDQELLQKGMNQEEVNVVKGRKEARDYAMQQWGWIRVADKYAQAWNITSEILGRIANGLYEAYGDDVFRQNFVVEMLSTGKNFASVPYSVIADGNVVELHGYIEFNDIAIAKKIKNWYKKSQNTQLWQMSPFSKEYANLDIDTIDRLAFGFSRNDIKQLLPNQLQIKWKDDMNAVLQEQKNSGLNPKAWANRISLSEPIDVIYENGVFKVDDGHHRYYAAKILNKPLNINLEIKDKPHQIAVIKALKEGKPVSQEIKNIYELV